MGREYFGFSGSSGGKESPCNAGDWDAILGWAAGEGNGHPFLYSCLENSMKRGAWWAAVHGVAKSQTDWVTKTQGIFRTA